MCHSRLCGNEIVKKIYIRVEFSMPNADSILLYILYPFFYIKFFNKNKVFWMWEKKYLNLHNLLKFLEILK